MNDHCSFCGLDLILDGAIDVLRHENGARMVDARPCCPHAAERPVEEWLGCKLTAMQRDQGDELTEILARIKAGVDTWQAALNARLKE